MREKKRWAKERGRGEDGVKKRMGGERRGGKVCRKTPQMKEKKRKRKNPAALFDMSEFLNGGGRKKSEGGGGRAHLRSNAAKQGMKIQESGFRQFF